MKEMLENTTKQYRHLIKIRQVSLNNLSFPANGIKNLNEATTDITPIYAFIVQKKKSVLHFDFNHYASQNQLPFSSNLFSELDSEVDFHYLGQHTQSLLQDIAQNFVTTSQKSNNHQLMCNRQEGNYGMECCRTENEV